MPYHRAKEIEGRLSKVLDLIQNGRYSTAALADKLNVSQPTISRCLSALRERGHEIRAIKDSRGWCFEIASAQRSGGR